MNEAASAVASRVDATELMRHCAEFAKRVKLSGTSEELESFRYLKSRLDAYGYRTELISHDAYISLPGRSRVTAEGRELESITHSFSLPSPMGGLTAELVDLRGGTPADFAVADCRGRIVLIDGIASSAVATRAKAAGAAGQLHVSPHKHRHEMCISPVWGNPSDDTLPEMPSTVACTVSREDGEALRAALAGGARLTVTLHAEVDTGWRKTPLLVAELDAPAAKDCSFILLSGHHDTWYYGVMDNGGANASMLEAARLLAEKRGSLKRGLRICFWSGHSHGRYSGSAWYADVNFLDLERRCAAHVNVDSVGGIGATVLTDNSVVPELAALAREVTFAESGQEHKGKRPSRSSDQSFWGIGIPSMYGAISHQPPGPVKMPNPLGWWWHTPHDLLDKIDEAYLARDARIVVSTLWHLLTEDILPLDIAAHAASLLSELRAVAAKIRDRLTLSDLLAAAERLEVRARRLTATEPSVDKARIEAVNAAIIQVCRALVPLDYTEGDRFAHDAALPQPAWPSLEKLRELGNAKPGSDEERFIMVSARRARNRAAFSLRQALDAAEAGLKA